MGEVMDHFEQKGLMENTLWIYVNDNGWDKEPQAEYRNDSLRWHNGGPRGKGSYYDQTYRSPIIFTWKGTLPQAKIKHELISSMDLLPTILDYVDLQKPVDLPGNSLRRNIAGETDQGRDQVFGRITQLFDPNDPTFIGQQANGYWTRTDRYHFVWDVDNKEELLFDMQSDPKNDQNIAQILPEKAEQFKKDIIAWRGRIGIN
ncbi:MAG: sulfatase-like hydrolase/transferase [Cytophagales bacterium]|nr:sulfatase-like hydrolase/transferase [Cytophagales bacterium]